MAPRMTWLALFLLVGLAGLVGLVFLVVALIRAGDSRPRRPRRGRPGVPAGPSGAQQAFAGCGTLLLVGIGLGVAYLLVGLLGRPGGALGAPEVVILGVGGVLYVAAFGWLAKSFRGATTAPGRPSGLMVWVVLPLLIAAGVGGVVASAFRDGGGFHLGAGEALIIGMAGFFYLNAVVKWFRAPAAAPAADPPPIPPAAAGPARDCPACGQRVPAGAPQGLCPRCLLKGVMPQTNQPSPTLAFVEAFVAPPVEDVVKLFPHLEVKELIGQGGMGAVYLARQAALDRPVALKLIRPREADPTFAERFAREARALARLTHPNVVTVHESGSAGGVPYLVMEYVDGVTLRDAMREKQLEATATLAVVRQLCDALEYAHAQGVVHRDVKPENILLTRDGRVKIADFGLAKVADPAAVSLTGTQQAMGTPHYMAPEQWEKPAAVDHRADLYALGVVLYELLTGELPLGRFDPPSQKVRLDVRLDEIVLRALAKEPDRRYQHAGDVRTDLDRVGTPAPTHGWVRTRTSREYRSRATFLGLPLVHYASGFDPRTGRGKTAVGWLAIGSGGAVGGVAFAGGWALGGVAVAGGGAVGLFGVAGGLALGGLALAGGWAVGAAVAAAGGFALSGGLAVAGGYALAPFAIGSSADGGYVLSSTRQSPEFFDRLRQWPGRLAELVRSLM